MMLSKITTYFTGIALLAVSFVASGRWVDVLPPLQDSDITIIQQKTRVELTDKPVGTVLDWTNPATKTSGSVTLVDRFWKEGRECRRIRHYIEIPKMHPWSQEITMCKQMDGQWKWE